MSARYTSDIETTLDTRMKLESRQEGEDLIVTVGEARVDAAIAVQFKDGMRKFIADGHDRVVLDLSNVGFLDSSGLGAVVAVMKLMGPDRRLDLAGLTPTVEKVFRLTRMDLVFKIFDDLDAAVSPSAATT